MANKKTLITVLALLIVGGAVYLYTLIGKAGDMWPAKNKPGSLTRSVATLQGQVQTLRVEVQRIPEAQEKLQTITVEYDLATRVLPRESSPDQLVAAIRIKAEQAGVIPDRLTPAVSAVTGGSRGSGSFEIWRFNLDIRGSYDQIATFINYMEEFEDSNPNRSGSEKRFFEVEQIRLNSKSNGMSFLEPEYIEGPESFVRHTCNLVMQTFRYTGQ